MAAEHKSAKRCLPCVELSAAIGIVARMRTMVRYFDGFLGRQLKLQTIEHTTYTHCQMKT
jgi:hypothetical protein